ncbi:MAG: S-adenosylmethionine decarboxylase [Patescibacteria group bacterium]
MNHWGKSISIDLYECNPTYIRSEKKIKQFVSELANLLNVKLFGECTVVHFGERDEIAGYSMTQLIETSLFSGHFANKTNTAYLDIFSCSNYDEDAAVNFSKEFFQAKSVITNTQYRK